MILNLNILRRLYFASLLGFALGGAAYAQLANPIPAPITKQGLRVEIHDLVQMPATLSTLGAKPDHTPGARARINFLRDSPDGRLFVNDLRGQLYTLDANHNPQLYVDLDAANGGAGSIFPAMRFNNGLAAGFVSFTFHPGFNTVGDDGYGKFYTIHMDNPAATTAVPDFSTTDLRTGNFPVTYHTVITEWSTPTPEQNAWNPAGVRREVLRVGTTANSYFHPYGDLQFNPLATPGSPDYGNLYVSGGDWGYINGAGAPQGSNTEGQPGQLQRLDTLAGTLIRIDPRSPSVTGGIAGLGDYTIPANNPLVDGNPNTLDEIYAFGFRNAHRMAWDKSDGSLYAMTVGHAQIEEIERIVPGGNYGWTNREGTFVNGNDLTSGGNGDADLVFANNVPNASDVDFLGQEYLYPALQYDHGEGNAIAGGFVYEGTRIPQLTGKYIFGDIVNGRIFAANMSALRGVDITNPATSFTAFEEVQLYTVSPSGLETNVGLRDLVGTTRADLRFGTDDSGELYILTKTDGYLRRLGANLEQQATRLAITVNRATGEVVVRNPTAGAIEFDGYSLLSPNGALNPASGAWQSLADQGVAGWQEAAPASTALSELNPASTFSIAASGARSLGAAFAPNPPAFGVSTGDLAFQYSNIAGKVFSGIVEYIGVDPNNLQLVVNQATGIATLKNTSPFSVSLEGYSIESASASLLPGNGNWHSLADQGVSGWQESGPTASALSELLPNGSLVLPSGASFNLGSLFNVNGVSDLNLGFLLLGEPTPRSGVVVYEAGLTGDYNLNGVVDAADYTLWRDTLGATVLAGTGADGNRNGTIDPGDYAFWDTYFGESLTPAASSTTAVPEPAGWLLVFLAVMLVRGTAPWAVRSLSL